MNEKVLVAKRKDFPKNIIENSFNNNESIGLLNKLDYKWYDRDKAETDKTLKQIIPYIIIQDSKTGKIGYYQRHGSERRIHNLYSVGVGGHINPEDADTSSLFNTIIKSAKRELKPK